MIGPKIARRIKKARTSKPRLAFQFPAIIRQTASQRDVAGE
jgi:hypothetical protein